MTTEGLVLTSSPACVKELRENVQLRKELASAISARVNGAGKAGAGTSGTSGSAHPLQQLSMRSHWADKPNAPYYGVKTP